jgi:hypothetical protein
MLLEDLFYKFYFFSQVRSKVTAESENCELRCWGFGERSSSFRKGESENRVHLSYACEYIITDRLLQDTEG